MGAAVPAAASSAADVGAGDGQLAHHLAARGLRVVATERSAGPFARLRTANPKLECRLGDGLGVLRPGEVEGVVLAGMGGRRMVSVLSATPEVVRKLDWLVLQPQQHAADLDRWLTAERFQVQRRTIAAERRRSYTVLLVKPPS